MTEENPEQQYLTTCSCASVGVAWRACFTFYTPGPDHFIKPPSLHTCCSFSCFTWFISLFLRLQLFVLLSLTDSVDFICCDRYSWRHFHRPSRLFLLHTSHIGSIHLFCPLIPSSLLPATVFHLIWIQFNLNLKHLNFRPLFCQQLLFPNHGGVELPIRDPPADYRNITTQDTTIAKLVFVHLILQMWKTSGFRCVADRIHKKLLWTLAQDLS